MAIGIWDAMQTIAKKKIKEIRKANLETLIAIVNLAHGPEFLKEVCHPSQGF